MADTSEVLDCAQTADTPGARINVIRRDCRVATGNSRRFHSDTVHRFVLSCRLHSKLETCGRAGGADHERVIRSIQTPGDAQSGAVGRPMLYPFADNGNVSLVNRQTSTPYAFLHASRTCPTLKRRSSFPPARGSNEIQPSYPPFLRTLKTPRMSTSPSPCTTLFISALFLSIPASDGRGRTSRVRVPFGRL